MFKLRKVMVQEKSCTCFTFGADASNNWLVNMPYRTFVMDLVIEYSLSN